MNAWTPSPADTLLHDAQAGVAGPGVHPLFERQLWILGRLAEAGLNIVLAIEHQALGSAPPPDAPAEPAPSDTPADTPANDLFQGDLALAYARASRAVRMTIALQSRLIDEAGERKRAAKSSAGYAAMIEGPARKARIERIVERVAQAELGGATETIERLVGEAAERLHEGDVYGDIMARPVSEIVDAICRDLGLHPDWARLAQEGWAQDEIASGAVGPPLAANLSPSSSHPPSSPSHALRPEGRRKPAPINVVERELAIRGPPSPG